jgi:uncharacterized membrane protein
MSRKNRRDELPVNLFSFQDIITSLSGIVILLTLMMALELLERPPTEAPATAAPAAPAEISEEDLAVLRARLAAVRQARQTRDSASPTARPSAVTLADRFQAATDLSRSLAEELNASAEERRRLEKEEAAARTLAEQAKAELERQQAATRAAELELDQVRRDRRLTLIPQAGSSKRPVIVECSAVTIRVARLGGGDRVALFDNDMRGQGKFQDYIRATFAKDQEYMVFMLKPSAFRSGLQLQERVREMGFAVGYDALEEEYAIGF